MGAFVLLYTLIMKNRNLFLLSFVVFFFPLVSSAVVVDTSSSSTASIYTFGFMASSTEDYLTLPMNATSFNGHSLSAIHPNIFGGLGVSLGSSVPRDFSYVQLPLCANNVTISASSVVLKSGIDFAFGTAAVSLVADRDIAPCSSGFTLVNFGPFASSSITSLYLFNSTVANLSHYYISDIPDISWRGSRSSVVGYMYPMYFNDFYGYMLYPSVYGVCSPSAVYNTSGLWEVYNLSSSCSPDGTLNYMFSTAVTNPLSVGGVCGSSVDACNTGANQNLYTNFVDASYHWQCAGSGGGVTVDCSAPLSATPLAGACGTQSFTCDVGNQVNYFTDTDGLSSWNCLGVYGGASSATCYAYSTSTFQVINVATSSHIISGVKDYLSVGQIPSVIFGSDASGTPTIVSTSSTSTLVFVPYPDVPQLLDCSAVSGVNSIVCPLHNVVSVLLYRLFYFISSILNALFSAVVSLLQFLFIPSGHVTFQDLQLSNRVPFAWFTYLSTAVGSSTASTSPNVIHFGSFSSNVGDFNYGFSPANVGLGDGRIRTLFTALFILTILGGAIYLTDII